MSPRKDITGLKFGKLTVIKYLYMNTHRQSMWECGCSCGNTFTTSSNSLRAGKAKSCGCSLVKSQSVLNRIYSDYKLSAEKRGYVFSLTLNDFQRLISLDCFYCGAPPSNTKKHSNKHNPNRELQYNGLDRLDNKLGYTLDNVVPSCFICNRAKQSMTFPDFRDWILKIGDNINSKLIRSASLRT